MRQQPPKKPVDRPLEKSGPKNPREETQQQTPSNKKLIHEIAVKRRQLLKELADL